MDAIEKLLAERTGSEPTREALLLMLLEEENFDPVVKHGVTSKDGSRGEIDIYVPSRNVVIEVKDSVRVKTPEKQGTGSREDESALEQLERYVLAEQWRRSNLLAFDESDRNQPFVGVVTDGHIVWMWNWDHNGVRSPNQDWQFVKLDSRQNVEQFLDRLKDQWEGKPWAPSDPTDIFRPLISKFQDLFRKVRSLDATQTQQHLWRKQLEISGQPPPTGEKDADTLFILHTLLIVIARGIGAEISGGLPDGIDSAGFVAWCNDQNWLIRSSGLTEIIRRYDWVGRPADVMRPIYGTLVEELEENYTDQRDKNQRKIFGEYYTPDWLAQGVVNKVLDDGWIKQQVQYANSQEPIRDAGVLDPACGSGTFLYHAARRILSQLERYGVTSPRRQADLVTRLVHGFDIHPVAVEMSRTTLLRALPTIPNVPLQVHQCDSLRTFRKAAEGELDFQDDAINLTSRLGESISVPLRFATSSRFEDDLDDIVTSAITGTDIPDFIHSREVVRDLHRKLSSVTQSEGNHVWSWYIRNQLGAVLLSNSKVDRIVANPPWVVMRNIQNPIRKREITELAQDQKIWVGGKNAPSFDIATMFAHYCPKLYLTLKRKAVCGWVLPYGAVAGIPWMKYREEHQSQLVELWDLGDLPFKQHSKSCVRFETIDSTTSKPIKLKEIRLNKNDGIHPNNSWVEFVQKTTWTDIQNIYNYKPSQWMENADQALARRGACLSPQCLVRIANKKSLEDDYQVTTTPSAQGPWDGLGTRSGTVPKSWVSEAVYAVNLVHFALAGRTEVVIPLVEDRNEFDPNHMHNQFWRDASSVYEYNKGAGSYTPATLKDNLNHRGKLAAQLERGPQSKRMVLVNKSGSWLVAARCQSNLIVEDTVYWVMARTMREALFLVGVLNAECLVDAFRSTKNSPQDFQAHFWRKIPIPRLDDSDSFHIELTRLSEKAELCATQVVEDNPGRTHKKLRELIREALADERLTNDINAVVSQILPDYCSRS